MQIERAYPNPKRPCQMGYAASLTTIHCHLIEVSRGKRGKLPKARGKTHICLPRVRIGEAIGDISEPARSVVRDRLMDYVRMNRTTAFEF
jgi:hypothetical protein